MTPEAQRMYDEMTELVDVFNSKDESIYKSITSITSKISEFEKTLRELIFDDDKIFDRIFNASYTSEHKLNVVAEFLDVDLNQLKLSTDFDETVSFTQRVMIHETLGELFNIVRYACDMTRRDFCIAWLILNEKGGIGKILIDCEKHHDKIPEDLREKFRKKKGPTNNLLDLLMKLGNASGLEQQEEIDEGEAH